VEISKRIGGKSWHNEFHLTQTGAPQLFLSINHVLLNVSNGYCISSTKCSNIYFRIIYYSDKTILIRSYVVGMSICATSIVLTFFGIRGWWVHLLGFLEKIKYFVFSALHVISRCLITNLGFQCHYLIREHHLQGYLFLWWVQYHQQIIWCYLGYFICCR
jgi:hypothetical protein